MSHMHKCFYGLYTKPVTNEEGEIVEAPQLHQDGFHVTWPKPIPELFEYEMEPNDYEGESGRKLGTVWSGVDGYWYILPSESDYLAIFPTDADLEL